MTAAIVENDRIVNRVVADPATYEDPQGREVVDGQYQIGWVRQNDGSFAPPQPSIAERKAAMQADTEAQYQRTLEAGFTDGDGTTWQVTQAARDRVLDLTQRIQEYRAGKINTELPKGKDKVRLYDADGNPHEVAADEIISLAEQGGDFKEDAQDRRAELMEQIEAAASHDDLDAIDPRTGWPS